jgi:hypothetical protein
MHSRQKKFTITTNSEFRNLLLELYPVFKKDNILLETLEYILYIDTMNNYILSGQNTFERWMTNQYYISAKTLALAVLLMKYLGLIRALLLIFEYETFNKYSKSALSLSTRSDIIIVNSLSHNYRP